MYWVTRESCFGYALLTWLVGGLFGLCYLVLGSHPWENWVGYALPGSVVVGLVLFFLALRTEFIIAVRDCMCEWGSGKASVTRFSYFLLLPFYVLGATVMLFNSAAQQRRMEAEGIVVQAELDEVFASIPQAQPTPAAAAPATQVEAGACPTCQRPVPAGKHCSYCGVPKVECPECHMKCPTTLTRCQYCRAALR